jgi:hypothetical protein
LYAYGGTLQVGQERVTDPTASNKINSFKIKPVEFTSQNVDLSSFTTEVPGIIELNGRYDQLSLKLPTGNSDLEGSIIIIHVNSRNMSNIESNAYTFSVTVNNQSIIDDEGDQTSSIVVRGGWAKSSVMYVCIYDTYWGYRWREYRCTD